jgi:hypothetical protein
MNLTDISLSIKKLKPVQLESYNAVAALEN